MPWLMYESIKIPMLKCLWGEVTFIPGPTSIPDSRVIDEIWVGYKQLHKIGINETVLKHSSNVNFLHYCSKFL